MTVVPWYWPSPASVRAYRERVFAYRYGGEQTLDEYADRLRERAEDGDAWARQTFREEFGFDLEVSG